MDLEPASEVVRVRRLDPERREIKPAFPGTGVVTGVAVRLEERSRLGLCGNTRNSEAQDQKQKPVIHTDAFQDCVTQTISNPRRVPLPVENSFVSIPRRWS